MKKLVVANWKMNGSLALIEAYGAICLGIDTNSVEGIVCPPFPLLTAASDMLGSQFSIGAQDCSTTKNGAKTGDISAELLSGVGVGYTIVGHSERRSFHGETSEDIFNKQERLLECGISPILCIGETEAERSNGTWKRSLEAQLSYNMSAGVVPAIVAYEPVWAIGTGLIPSTDIIIETIHHIRKTLTHGDRGKSATRILYGGSADEKSAARIVGLAGVDGLLVGGASLDAQRFKQMLTSVSETNWDVLRD